MQLKELIKNINFCEIKGDFNKEIEKIVHNSKNAENNNLFICIEGFQTDGHRYIEEARKKGVNAVVIEKELDNYYQDLTYIRVEDSRKAMAGLAEKFYNYPQKDLKLIGVTGTNGKTTTTYLINKIISEAGYKTGLIGTINILIDDKQITAERTTPESLEIYKHLALMKNRGVEYVVMEVSSHALDLHRVEGINFDAAIFTNLTQDHLDYHNSLEEYLKAKAKLFKKIKKDGYGIVNIDNKYSDYILENIDENIFTYGIKQEADIMAVNNEVNLQGIKFDIKGIDISTLNLNISGKFNIMNTLAAIGCAKTLGFENQVIKKGLEKFSGVPGRFELIKEGQDYAVVVDYAHTPDGMENVLTDVKSFVKGNIIVIFGCGGDRDQGKRPLMGEIGVKYGNYCVLTNDNPRTEDPDRILEQIENGIKNSGFETPYQIIPNRRNAIYHGIKKAASDDIVIIFGKGHETYQIFKDKKIDFDDREVARKAIKNTQDER